MDRLRLIVLAAFAATLLGFLQPSAARATVCTVPNVFTTGTTINAGPFNANFTALQTCGNNIDNSNIGTAGIYASQIACSTVATCTFNATATVTSPTTIASAVTAGTANAFTWENGASGTTGLFTSAATAVNGVVGQSEVIGQNGGSNLLALDNAGDVGTLGYVAAGSYVTASQHPLPFDPRYGTEANYHIEAGTIMNFGPGTYNITFTTAYAITPESCQVTPESYLGTTPTSGVLFIKSYNGGGPYTGMTIQHNMNVTINASYFCVGY